MEELDCVRLIKPFENMEVVTEGCIVLKYNDKDYSLSE